MISLEEFELEIRSEGYDEVVIRKWEPNDLAPPHQHPFAAKLLICEGEMWITVGDTTRHLQAGDRYELPSGQLHSERYGPAGAIYWAARKNP
jgi:quercetin dioxygenase-like cupin family protein